MQFNDGMNSLHK